MTQLYEKLKSFIGEENVLRNEPMSGHTTFRIGGPASVFVNCGSEEELGLCLKLCNENGVRYYIIGNGSNLLVSDDGFAGVIIAIGKRMSDIRIDGNRIYAQAGALLSAVAAAAARESLTGLEFASGIPGNVGGAVIMNAGAYDGEMKNVLESVRLMDREGNITEEPASALELSYRHSNISEREMIVLSAVLKPEYGDRKEIDAKIADFSQRRRDKQPLEYPSAGSTFKRPDGYFAGKLISDSGMKGFSVGGAQVSEKHAGFVINTGNATCRDVIELTDKVSEEVFRKYGVRLEREIRILG